MQFYLEIRASASALLHLIPDSNTFQLNSIVGINFPNGVWIHIKIIQMGLKHIGNFTLIFWIN